MSTAEHVVFSWHLAKGNKLQAKYRFYKSGPAVMPDFRDVGILQLRPAGSSWWPLILNVGQNNWFSREDSDFYALSSLSVTNASWGNWDQKLLLVSLFSHLWHTTASPGHFPLFGNEDTGGKLYHGLVLIWTCQSGNHKRWEAIFVTSASLDISVPQCEMLSTVYVIILVKALISPFLFSKHAAWCQGWIMWQCLKARLQQCSCLSVIFLFDASGGLDNLTFSL